MVNFLSILLQPPHVQGHFRGGAFHLTINNVSRFIRLTIQKAAP